MSLVGEFIIIVLSVLPLSVLFAKNTFQCPVSLFVHAMKTVLFPVGAIGTPALQPKKKEIHGLALEERHLPHLTR